MLAEFPDSSQVRSSGTVSWDTLDALHRIAASQPVTLEEANRQEAEKKQSTAADQKSGFSLVNLDLQGDLAMRSTQVYLHALQLAETLLADHPARIGT